MPLSGKLRTWHDDRGYGFIAPRDGGRELFVHISSFPKDGSRPTVGETLIFELGRGKDGKPQAVNVYRQAIGKPSTRSGTQPATHQRTYSRDQSRSRSSTRSPFTTLITLAILIALGAFAYKKYDQYASRSRAQAIAAPQEAANFDPSPTSFRCDGRKHCSQMTSCTEAKFFLKNCPGTQMDGNHDGVPCEQQWCTSRWAN